MQTRNKARLKLLFLFALFFVPYFSAVYLYKLKPEMATINQGELLKPSIPLADFASVEVKPKNWFLVYFTKQGKACDKTCLNDVAMSRQVRMAFAKDYPRIHLLLLAAIKSDIKKNEHPDLVQMSLNKQIKEGLYVADPHGQLILYYGTHVEPKPIYQDLQRLLQYG